MRFITHCTKNGWPPCWSASSLSGFDESIKHRLGHQHSLALIFSINLRLVVNADELENDDFYGATSMNFRSQAGCGG